MPSFKPSIEQLRLRITSAFLPVELTCACIRIRTDRRAASVRATTAALDLETVRDIGAPTHCRRIRWSTGALRTSARTGSSRPLPGDVRLPRRPERPRARHRVAHRHRVLNHRLRIACAGAQPRVRERSATPVRQRHRNVTEILAHRARSRCCRSKPLVFPAGRSDGRRPGATPAAAPAQAAVFCRASPTMNGCRGAGSVRATRHLYVAGPRVRARRCARRPLSIESD
jgi:hypothetical protein